MDKKEKLVPVFENGLAKPIFPFTDGKTGKEYDAKTSDIVRFCVYVETDYDMDGDGKRDLVKVFVQVPRSAAEGNYKAATIYEARPYTAGVMADAYDHMKEVENKTYKSIDKKALWNSPEPRKSTEAISSLAASYETSSKDWYYLDEGSKKYCFDNIDLYDYYLIRGFAVVECAGLGTRGSEGYECVGTTFEKEAFKNVVEWLTGDRKAFLTKDSSVEVKADFSNGKIGMTGRSYGGTMPFAVATTGVKGLETIVPVAGIASWYEQQNQQGAQRYWPKEQLNTFLSYYCSSLYSDPKESKEGKEKIAAYQYQMAVDQIKCGFDYDEDFWGQGDYTKDAKKIKCSALIVHGLNDENVSTKQFEMMFSAFKKAGQNAKLILHQGYHLTPTMVDKGYGFLIDGKKYQDILNRWFSHYLYGVKNDAENMSEVLVQDNRNQDIWHTFNKWHVGTVMDFKMDAKDALKDEVIDTDWGKAGINSHNADEKMSLHTSNMNRRYMTKALDKEMLIQGTIKVSFEAALNHGDSKNDFHGKNVNDADTLTMKTGTGLGIMDDVKMTVLVCDYCKETFDSIQTTDPERNVIPHYVVKEKALVQGGELESFDEIKFDTVNKNYKVISRSYIDLCNPKSAYESYTATSKDAINLVEGEFHNYEIYLNAKHYALEPGHQLMVVLATEDPVECLIHKDYSIKIKQSSIKMRVPVIEGNKKLDTIHSV